jgi:hypothetical protein
VLTFTTPQAILEIGSALTEKIRAYNRKYKRTKRKQEKSEYLGP